MKIKDIIFSNNNRIKLYFSFMIIFWAGLIITSPLIMDKIVSTINPNTYLRIPVIGYYQQSNLNSLNTLIDINTNISCQPKFPTEKVIILRMDDIQKSAYNDLVINLTETVLSKNMSITLGVIPKNITDDSIIKTYLLSKINDPRIEIAQHGINHTYQEFLPNITKPEVYDMTKPGLDQLIMGLHVYPVTFIPPNNEYNEKVPIALKELGFKIFSAKKGEYKFSDGIMYIGFDSETKYSSRDNLTPIKEMIDDCKRSLGQKNFCVILTHPQDYANEDRKTLNIEKYEKFIELLDELEKMDSKYVTFKDLLIC